MERNFIGGLQKAPTDIFIKSQNRINNLNYLKQFGNSDTRRDSLMSGMPESTWNASMLAPGGGISPTEPIPSFFRMNPTLLRSFAHGGPIGGNPWEMK